MVSLHRAQRRHLAQRANRPRPMRHARSHHVGSERVNPRAALWRIILEQDRFPDIDARRQSLREILYCERVLAKTGDNVLRDTLGSAIAVDAWHHFPQGDVYDPESGAQWYYHCHPPGEETVEHGHFHCFVRPQGHDGPTHHLIAIGVDAYGKLLRLFTVNHWVVGDDWLDASATIALLPRFDVQLGRPSYLVNRWLTSVVRLHEREIAGLLEARDQTIEAFLPSDIAAAKTDRTLEVTSAMPVDLNGAARRLSIEA